jgi:RNA polymerase sigma-70 factor (ECF subfamily)
MKTTSVTGNGARRPDFTLLYKLYWDRLVALATAHLSSAEDGKEIVQQVLVSFYLKNIEMKDNTKLFSYLCRAVRNKAFNYKRDRQNHLRHLHTITQSRPFAPEHTAEPLSETDLLKEVNRCLLKLPRRYAEVFLLNWRQGFSVREAAKWLARSESTVEKQLKKARFILREHFDTRILF